MSRQERIRATVSGVVQGVGFRYFAAAAALRLDITGWVQNRSNGSVEVVAEGDSGILREFVKTLQLGPRSARVTGVDVWPEEYRAEFQTFEIR